MQSTQSTPPALYYSPPVTGDDRSRESSASESTPHTPVTFEAPYYPVSKNEKQRFGLSKKPVFPKRNSNFLLGSDWNFDYDPSEPLFEDEGDANLPLFAGGSPLLTSQGRKMAEAIDISLPPRITSSQSPRNQQSNLTSALQEAGASGQNVPEMGNMQYMGVPEPGRLSVSGRHDSMSNMFGSSYYGSGARPIATRDRPRRESNTGGGSFMGGMSWGGISVGSLRDEYVHSNHCDPDVV